MTRVPDDALGLLRRCQDRVLEREGIPMVLALVDETSEAGRGRPPLEESVAAEGARLADLMDEFGQALAPTGRDGDLARVVMVMQALSYLDFGQDRTVL